MGLLLLFASSDPSSSLALASGHGYGKSKGQVHINVWRGPSKGYGKYKFAPWGYYAKLPADDAPHYKHHY